MESCASSSCELSVGEADRGDSLPLDEVVFSALDEPDEGSGGRTMGPLRRDSAGGALGATAIKAAARRHKAKVAASTRDVCARNAAAILQEAAKR